MNICLFSSEEISLPLSTKDERGNHLIKILHKKEGDTFSAGIIGNQAGTATITKIQNDNIYFDFIPETDGKELFPLKMIIGFPRPIQLKRLLRDVAALGVSEVHLTGTELGEKSYMKSNLAEHENSYKMLLDGTVQAASTHIPELIIHKTLSDCIKTITTSSNTQPLKLALDNINPTTSLTKALQNNNSQEIIAAIGSERGWTNKERDFLEQNGFIRCGMGNRVMRTETAATVAASIISANCGWLD